MTAVECLVKSGPYSRHVSDGVLESAPLTGKNSSVGLRMTWYTQLAVDQTARTTNALTTRRTANGAAHSARNARRRDLARSRMVEIRKRRLRLLREVVLAAWECAMKECTCFISLTKRRHSRCPSLMVSVIAMSGHRSTFSRVPQAKPLCQVESRHRCGGGPIVSTRGSLSVLGHVSTRWMRQMPKQTRPAPRYWMGAKGSPKISQPRNAAVTTSHVAMVLAWLAGRSRRPMV